MRSDVAELEKDLKEALSHIDFKEYDPYSKPFMKALFIGQMLSILKCLGDDDVEEELDGAETYFKLYEDTGDSTYKGMASDELRHADILIKKHLAKTSDSEKREILNEHEKRRQEMLKKISATNTQPKSME